MINAFNSIPSIASNINEAKVTTYFCHNFCNLKISFLMLFLSQCTFSFKSVTSYPVLNPGSNENGSYIFTTKLFSPSIKYICVKTWL